MAPPSPRKRRQADSESIHHLHRVLSFPQGGAGVGSPLPHQVSSMKRLASFSSLRLQENVQPAQELLLHTPPPSDSKVDSIFMEASSPESYQLAGSWLHMSRRLAHMILKPEPRHFVTSAFRLVNEDILPLMIERVQRAFAGLRISAPTTESILPGASPLSCAQEFATSCSSPNMDAWRLSTSLEVPAVSTTEPMDWEEQRKEPALAVSLNITLNIYM